MSGLGARWFGRDVPADKAASLRVGQNHEAVSKVDAAQVDAGGPMLAIVLFGATFSGRELAVVATVIIVFAGLLGRYLFRGR